MHLTACPVHPWAHPVVIFSVPEPSSRQDPYTAHLRSVMVSKPKEKALEPRKIGNPKLYPIPGWVADISATIGGFKDGGGIGGDPCLVPTPSSTWPVLKTGAPWGRQWIVASSTRR